MINTMTVKDSCADAHFTSTCYKIYNTESILVILKAIYKS